MNKTTNRNGYSHLHLFVIVISNKNAAEKAKPRKDFLLHS